LPRLALKRTGQLTGGCHHPAPESGRNKTAGGYQVIAFIDGWPFSPGMLGLALAILVAG
jgi:hypothetical protein